MTHTLEKMVSKLTDYPKVKISIKSLWNNNYYWYAIASSEKGGQLVWTKGEFQQRNKILPKEKVGTLS